tara:strand:+ start:266 stop:868 length:603 start_codon:yes stop_codon:yes gene_type:complete
VSNQENPMLLSEFLTTSFQNVRSSKRTDELHKVLLDEVLNSNSDWAEYDWQFEYKLPVDGFGGTFDIDIDGFRDDELKVAVLAKAINSNVNKNIKNYANTTIGEAARIFYAPGVEIEKILFLSVLPRIAPRFNNQGSITGYDDVVSAKNRTRINGILQLQYGGVAESKDLYFDIEDVKMKESKSDFDIINVANLDELVVA